MVMICATGKQFYASLVESVCLNVLMQLKMILWEFGRICVTRNALMQLKTILCEFGLIWATRNALKQLEMILCDF